MNASYFIIFRWDIYYVSSQNFFTCLFNFRPRIYFFTKSLDCGYNMGKIPFKKISPQGKQYNFKLSNAFIVISAFKRLYCYFSFQTHLLLSQLSNAFIVISAFKRLYCYFSFLTWISQLIKRGIWLPEENFSVFEFEVTCDYTGWTKNCITFETLLSLVIVAQFQSQID